MLDISKNAYGDKGFSYFAEKMDA